MRRSIGVLFACVLSGCVVGLSAIPAAIGNSLRFLITDFDAPVGEAVQKDLNRKSKDEKGADQDKQHRRCPCKVIRTERNRGRIRNNGDKE